MCMNYLSEVGRMNRWCEAVVILVLALSAIASAFGAQNKLGTRSGDKTAEVKPPAPVLVGRGDISSCDDLAGAEATAKLIEQIAGTVVAVGDLAYPDGSDEQFAKCYDPTWGRFRNRTRPVPGNHEYHNDGASGYARYFGAAAGDPKKGYYGYIWGAGISVLWTTGAHTGGGGVAG